MELKKIMTLALLLGVGMSVNNASAMFSGSNEEEEMPKLRQVTKKSNRTVNYKDLAVELSQRYSQTPISNQEMYNAVYDAIQKENNDFFSNPQEIKKSPFGNKIEKNQEGLFIRGAFRIQNEINSENMSGDDLEAYMYYVTEPFSNDPVAMEDVLKIIQNVDPYSEPLKGKSPPKESGSFYGRFGAKNFKTMKPEEKEEIKKEFKSPAFYENLRSEAASRQAYIQERERSLEGKKSDPQEYMRSKKAVDEARVDMYNEKKSIFTNMVEHKKEETGLGHHKAQNKVASELQQNGVITRNEHINVVRNRRG